jgi:hypothetical protein
LFVYFDNAGAYLCAIFLVPSKALLTSVSLFETRTKGAGQSKLIAQAAHESLTAVSVYMRDITRQMADDIETLPVPKTAH